MTDDELEAGAAPAREIWIYPLARGQSLPRCDWVPLYFDRLLNSRFVALVDPAAGFYAVILWAASMRQDPAGTLPAAEVELARLAGLGKDLDAWRRVAEGALYGWRPTLVEGAEPGDGERLGHPVVASVAFETYQRVVAATKSATDGARRKALSRIRICGRKAGLPESFLAAPGVAEAIAERLAAAGRLVSPGNVREAAERYQVEADRLELGARPAEVVPLRSPRG